MSDLDRILAGNHDAVNDLLAAAEGTGSAWNTPRAPGKWSPSQIVEHVAMVLEESANVVQGHSSKFPTLPAFVRPVVGLFLKRVVKKNAFPKAKAAKSFSPLSGPATPDAGRTRLEGAVGKFTAACRTRAATGQRVAHPGFGNISVADYARFQELHTRHHRKQIGVP